MDDLPPPKVMGVLGYQSITHTAHFVLGTKFYMCGGYYGSGEKEPPNVPYCFIYDHAAPEGQQWSESANFPDLPRTAQDVPHRFSGTGAAGMIYDSATNTAVYAGGAVRDDPIGHGTYDVADAWKIDLGNMAAGWQRVSDIPLKSNHMSSVTAKDHTGTERHFFLGGQHNGDEGSGNYKEVYEYIVATDTWVRHTDMLLTRGHASSSTRAFGCGFIIAGGTTNEVGRTSEIHYYDIPSLTWTKIGDLPNSENAPICDFYTPPPNTGGTQYFHCASPFDFLVAGEISP
jgi:hypothetical protein